MFGIHTQKITSVFATHVDGWSYLSVLRVYIDPIHWGACDGGLRGLSGRTILALV